LTDIPIDYRSAGVDYDRIDALKVRAQQAARATSRHLSAHGARELERSRGE
jgi:phosphoribosylformylglycinamidine cyclo-ligase